MNDELIHLDLFRAAYVNSNSLANYYSVYGGGAIIALEEGIRQLVVAPFRRE